MAKSKKAVSASEQKKATEVKIKNIRKITPKIVAGSVKDLYKKSGEVLFMRVYGIATKIFTTETTFGPSTGFKGQFVAVNIITGETFKAPKIYLPDVANDYLVPALEQDGKKEVQFAFDIGVVKATSEKSAYEYEYTVQQLIGTSENDPVALLEKNLPELPALSK